ncbi:MAG: hypothetical protein QG597_5144, partial [Actinomycetota bacterium]|nr:hypothetical protein [Actinomycetota bacterium]
SMRGDIPHSGLQYTWETFEKEKDKVIPDLKRGDHETHPTTL